jgi:hypothetical protein
MKVGNYYGPDESRGSGSIAGKAQEYESGRA